MINSILTIITIIIEYITMLYYCNSILKYRTSKHQSIFIVTLGYILYCIACLFENTFINIAGFIVINFFVIYCGYSISITNTIIKVIIFTGMMMFCELIAGLLIEKKLDNELADIITSVENIIFTFASGLLYITIMVIFRYKSTNRDQRYQTKEMLYLIVLPIATCLFLYLFNQISTILSYKMEILFVIFSVLLITANFVVYFVCEKIIDNYLQNERLKEIEFKKEINEKSYQLIQEKYNDLKILVHDFDKYCNYIDGIIANGHGEVQTFIKKIRAKNKEFLIVEYTNNKALNILLSQKIKECNEKQIDFQIYAQNVDLSFIEETDMIAIFGNLIDNAIESCMISEAKKMFLQIKIMNDKVLVITIENSADKEPIIENGKLKTRKEDKDNHGVGMLSVKQALNNYNGKLKWEYDEDKRIFVVTILIGLYKNRLKDANVAV